MNPRRFVAVVFVVLSAALLGCSRQVSEPSRSMSFVADNNKRAEVGVRSVKTTWSQLRSQHGCERWADGKGILCKVAKLTSMGALEWEEDYYQSGKTFTDPDGTFPEMLTVHFNYTTRSVAIFYRGTNQAINRMAMPFEKYDGDPSDATNALLAADSVLATWGMTRL